MTDTLELGKILNSRYRIISVLGRGGMSNVYLVEDDKLKSRWALKEMLDIFPDQQKTEILERFRKEAEILAGMKHANLPRVFDYFEEEGRHYLVMEYIEGLTMEEIISRNQTVPVERVLDWSIQICDVLETLHNQGIIYRDLKPSNIMVDKDDKISLIDFGIARLFTGNKIHDTIIIGTPGFASPEHHGTSETDARSDIYSLGATMHYLLTGRDPGLMPFVFEDPAKLRPQLSPELSAVVMEALVLNPGERIQSAGKLREKLEKIQKPKTAQGPAKTIAKSPESTPVRAAKEPPPASVPDTPCEGPIAIPFTGDETFHVDLFRAYLYPAAISGGLVFLLAWILTMGAGISGPMFLYSLGAWLPSTFLARKVSEYVFKIPRSLAIRLRPEGLTFTTSTGTVKASWDQVNSLLIFREKSRVGITITKYRLSTNRGDFEYTGDLTNLHRFNDLIITHSGLHLSGETGFYRRYTR